MRGSPKNSHSSFKKQDYPDTLGIHMDPLTSTSRIPRRPWQFTCILPPQKARLHGFPDNSHGSFDLDKKECTDMPGIHMHPWTSTCRSARTPLKFTRFLQEAGLHGYPRNSHASFDLKKQDCTDTLGIHMDAWTSTCRNARNP